MKRILLALATFALASTACAKKLPPPEEPEVAEVVSDAGPPEPIDAAPPTTLYDRLGGKDGVDAIVDSFTKNILADPRVNKSFKKSKDGLSAFKQRMDEELCQLAAGPCQYGGKSMADAHKALNVTDAQFDAFIEDLKLALDEKGTAEADKNALSTALAPLKADIVKARKK